MIRLFFVIFAGAAACGTPPCKDYCTTACNKYAVCGVRYHGGPPISATDVPACANTCFTDVQAAHVSDAQCNADIQTVNGQTCDQFVAALNSKG